MNMQRHFRWEIAYLSLVIFALMILTCRAESQIVASHGLNPLKALTRYTLDVWQTKDGLPHNHVQAILQTSDGYLWIGTEVGLARFDGVSFDVFDIRNTPALRGNSILALCEDHDGTLWIGGSEELVSYRHGEFTRCPVENDYFNGEICTLLVDRDSALWIGGSTGLARLKNGKFTRYTSKNGFSNSSVHTLCTDSDGNISDRNIEWTVSIRQENVYRL